MGKQNRHNIDTIANVLIDKLNEMEKTAIRIERASQQPLKIDMREIEQLFQDKKKAGKAILSDLSALKEKNRGRVPSWVIVVLSAVFLISIGLSLYAWRKAEQYELQKSRAEHFEQMFIESQKRGN